VFNGKKLSVVMPAYNEEEHIKQAVRDFLSIPLVDEVVVVDNNSKDDTCKLAGEAGARVIKEKNQGYGFACQRALREASGGLIVLVEPDGTFDARDLHKFLAYADDFDMVLGTRTTRELIWEGANMDHFLKWGNWTLGKMVELLYSGPSLSDVGCTYRLIKKEALDKIEKNFTVGRSHFSPEMMILALKNKIRVVEIPVNYRPRRGESKITGRRWPAFKLGLIMIALIVKMRFT